MLEGDWLNQMDLLGCLSWLFFLVVGAPGTGMLCYLSLRIGCGLGLVVVQTSRRPTDGGEGERRERLTALPERVGAEVYVP